MTEAATFIQLPDPENPGWFHWRISDERRFNAQVMGKMIVRLEDDGTARLRMFPEMKHSNLMGNLHGGTILSLIDIGMFAAMRMFGLIEAGTAVTLDMNTQFIGAGVIDVPLDCEVELLKETRRLLFLRGLVVQGDVRVAAWSGTIRKPTAR
ncbi:MAG: hypothetical protein RLZZ366_773 [Pseudomonadota bacterium]|jgi:uncharacterized protein (TIGR00369 family)